MKEKGKGGRDGGMDGWMEGRKEGKKEGRGKGGRREEESGQGSKQASKMGEMKISWGTWRWWKGKNTNIWCRGRRLARITGLDAEWFHTRVVLYQCLFYIRTETADNGCYQSQTETSGEDLHVTDQSRHHPFGKFNQFHAQYSSCCVNLKYLIFIIRHPWPSTLFLSIHFRTSGSLNDPEKSNIWRTKFPGMF